MSTPTFLSLCKCNNKIFAADPSAVISMQTSSEMMALISRTGTNAGFPGCSNIMGEKHEMFVRME